eukprot:9681176-Alexandrium_andersonii.AAC.1
MVLSFHSPSVPERTRPQTVELFDDARGQPPRLAAVLFDRAGAFWTEHVPTAADLAGLVPRKDKHIMALELLAALLGFCSFAGRLRGRMCRLWSDDAGAECT